MYSLNYYLLYLLIVFHYTNYYYLLTLQESLFY